MRKTAHKYWIYAAVFAVVIALSSLEARAQQFGVKTNALMWGFCAPNAGVEIVIGERCSLDISGFAKPSLSKGNSPLLNSYVTGFQPEFRYWYSAQPMSRGYVGLIGLGGFYKGDFGQDTYDGYGGGAGVSLGYVFNLTKRLNLELSTGMGAFYYHQKKYWSDREPEDLKPEKGYMLIPFQAGVSISYVLK
jgi:hypothetical protein